MKRTSTILPILLGFGIATLLACGGVQNPYSPSINGTTTTTGGGSFGLAIQPPQNTIYTNGHVFTKQGRGIVFQRSTTFTLIIDFAGGWNKSVALTADTPSSGWMDVSLDKSSVPASTSNQTATLTCTLNSNWDSEFQNVTVPVHATSGGSTVTKNAIVVISNANFSVAVTPSPQSMPNTGTPNTLTYTVTVTPSNGYTGPVALSVTNPNSTVFSTSLDSSSLNITNATAQTTTLHVTRITSTSTTGDQVFSVTGDGSHSIRNTGSFIVTLFAGGAKR